MKEEDWIWNKIRQICTVHVFPQMTSTFELKRKLCLLVNRFKLLNLVQRRMDSVEMARTEGAAESE